MVWQEGLLQILVYVSVDQDLDDYEYHPNMQFVSVNAKTIFL